jgi:hypothetical protein
MSYHPTRITNNVVERNIRQQRIADTQRQQLNQFATENSKLLSAANAQEKVELRRHQAYQEMCQNEKKYDERIKEELRKKKQIERELIQNNALATELDLRQTEEDRRKKEIQRICEDAPELRELERALKIAYLNKERATQQEEKILIAAREQERIQAIEEQMEYDRKRALKGEAAKIELQKEAYKKQRAILQQQIEERKLQLKEAQEQAELDKMMVESIVKKINAEDEADLAKRRERQAATTKLIREYEDQRQRELAAARAREKAEEERIAEYNRFMEARNKGIAEKKQAKKEEEDRIFREIVEETERRRREEEEFNSLRDLLWEEELEAKRAEDVQRRMNKQQESKREMMEANNQMMRAKVEQRMKEMEDEAKMVSLMRRKFAEDEARERAEDEARKQARRNYMALIEDQRRERKYMTDQERAKEIAEAEELQAREDYRRKVIQEARKRLLEEHAGRLVGYLPRKVVENDEEMEIYDRLTGMQV